MRAVVDWDELLDRVDGDRAFVEELWEAFDETCGSLLEQIRTAVEYGDGETLGKAAHALKGALGSLSAHAAYDVAARLEAEAKAGDLSEIAGRCRTLEEEIGRLASAMVAFREESTP